MRDTVPHSPQQHWTAATVYTLHFNTDNSIYKISLFWAKKAYMQISSETSKVNKLVMPEAQKPHVYASLCYE